MYEVGLAATLITSIALVGVGVVIGVSQLRNRSVIVPGTWFFVITCFALAMWLFANTLSDADAEHALLWVRISFASIAVGLTSLLLFVNRFPTPRYISRRETLAPVALLGVMILLIVSPLFIPDVTFEAGISTVEPGPLYIVFVLFVISVLSLTFSRLIQASNLSKRYRAQVNLILGGVTVTAVVAFATNLLLPLITGSNNLYWLASVSTLAFVIATAYAIVKEGLFDVRFAAMRTVAYAGTLATIIGMYYIVVSVFAGGILSDQDVANVAIGPLTIIPALIFVITFPPIKRFFDRLTNKLFFQDSYSSEDFFAEFGLLLASTTDLRGLLERASGRIAETFKAEQAFFHLYYAGSTNHHMSVGTHRHAKLPNYDAGLLDEHVHGHGGGVILTDFLVDIKLRRMLQSHKVALVLPLLQNDRIVGYLMLGDHLSNYYSKRDIAILSSISSGLLIAIQNALSLHEVKELNATLQQRIDVATKELRSSNAQLKHIDEVKNEFMSMASHQLRTPLTSVKGYLSMLLDGDAGDVTPQQKKLITEAYGSSERMVRIIADFLNVSRMQTGKFVIEKTEVEIRHIVRQEVENLKLMAKTRQLKLDLKTLDHDLVLHADAAKIREVVMNFLDNAIYYSKPESTIKITLEQHPKYLEFTVKDTGIGVPEDEQKHLFGKFYRATNARKQRPDGTGVGLYLTRKVLRAHNGEIIFHSKEGKGSTFGFRLPLSTK